MPLPPGEEGRSTVPARRDPRWRLASQEECRCCSESSVAEGDDEIDAGDSLQGEVEHIFGGADTWRWTGKP